MITHFFKFADQATAQASVPKFWQGSDWDRSRVDGPVPIPMPDGTFEPGYHLNIGSPALDPALVATPGFIGARNNAGILVAGTQPVSPTRVFA